MRPAMCLTFAAVLGCSTSAPAVFHPTDPSFRPSPGPSPRLYDRANLDELRRFSVRSVGLIRINVPESSGRKRVLELAVEKGRELGCWVVVEHSAFTSLNAALEDGARLFLAHAGGHEAAPGALQAEFDCVLKTQT